MFPPPGTYFLNYVTYYTAGSLKDKDGNNAIPKFELDALANVFRVVHVTKSTLLGGNIGMQAILPLVHLEVAVPGRSQSNNGLGDLVISPLILSWHSKNMHYAAGVDVDMPIGAYDKNDLANIGRNYWTFTPIVAATYMSDSGYEISGKFMYDINTENNDTNYQSGNEFHVDYTLAKKIGAYSLGAGGYFYKQVTDDEVNGAKHPNDGNKGQVFAIGPQIKYDYKNMAFSFKYQKELLVENKPEGDKFWLSLMYAF
ncbi:MAG: transporter [Geobacteraceae bacterium]|nr:transporter [Geobacteraceae bacterium]